MKLIQGGLIKTITSGDIPNGQVLIDGGKIVAVGQNLDVPAGTEINEIMIKDKVCYLDLSAEFQKNQSGGPREEALTIYSIVNSLTELPNIQYVQFLIDGQRVETYKTEVKLGSFLSPNALYVKVEENE